MGPSILGTGSPLSDPPRPALALEIRIRNGHSQGRAKGNPCTGFMKSLRELCFKHPSQMKAPKQCPGRAAGPWEGEAASSPSAHLHGPELGWLSPEPWKSEPCHRLAFPCSFPHSSSESARQPLPSKAAQCPASLPPRNGPSWEALSPP